MWKNNDGREANFFNVSVSAQSLLTGGQWDLFGFTCSSGSRVEIIQINIGQSSTAPAGIQSLGVQFIRGSTAASTGAAITPVNTKGWTGAPASLTLVTGPSSTLVSTASAKLVYTDAFEAASGLFKYKPAEGRRIALTNSQRLVVRVSTPQVPITVYGSVTFRELGYGLPA